MPKHLAAITVQQLKTIAEEADYSWRTEVRPKLDEVQAAMLLFLETQEICMLALQRVLGRPRKREHMARGKPPCR